jgi:D-alanyl-D-alanine carboxypeptidase (penicillin-binding protein 5/6)
MWLRATAVGLAMAAMPAPAFPASGAKAGAGNERPFVATVLMDAGSGELLEATNPQQQWPPASMAKMMLMLLVAERLADGRLTLATPVRVSTWASKMGGSQVYLKEGEVFPLGEMMQAVVIASANDAAVAVAEQIAGSIDAFVALMNERAGALGLSNTVYRTVHGLPPGRGKDKGDDLTSAEDLGKLGRELVGYSQIVRWTSTREAPFRNGTFILRNTNHLLRSYSEATGLKTGYHAGAGFGLTASATHGDLTLIAVVLGAKTKRSATEEGKRLLTHGFATYRVVNATEAGRPLGAVIPVEGGDAPEVGAVAATTLRLLVKRSPASDPQVELRLPHLLEAPVRKGQRVGQALVLGGGRTLGQVDVLADRDVAAVGWIASWRRWWSSGAAAE